MVFMAWLGKVNAAGFITEVVPILVVIRIIAAVITRVLVISIVIAVIPGFIPDFLSGEVRKEKGPLQESPPKYKPFVLQLC